MKRLLVLFITIACAASSAHAEPAAGTTVRDRLWIFGVPDIVTLAKKYPNITGIYLDDFVKDPVERPDGRMVGKPAITDAEFVSIREQFAKVGRPMEVWTTIYSIEFDPEHPDFRDCEPPLVESMNHFDVLVFWTWKSDELVTLEKNLSLLEAVKPANCRIALGI